MANDVDEIKFSLGLKTEKFSKGLREIDKEMEKITKRDLKVEALNPKGLKKFKAEVKASTKGMNVLYKTIQQGSKKHGKLLQNEVRDYQKAYKNIETVVKKHTTALALARKSEDKDRIKEAKKIATQEIKIAKGALRGQQNILHNKIRKTGGHYVVKERQEAKAKAEAFQDAIGDFKWGEAGKEVGEGVKDVISSLKAKDLAGVAKGLFTTAGKTAKGLGMGALNFAQKNKDAGGMKGAMSKGINKVAGMDGMVKVFASIGPIMSMMSSALIGIVKLFLDCDAQIKEMNKDLLDGASLAETFASEGNNSARSYEKLSGTMSTIRDQITDFKMNNAMGTSAKDHAAVLKVLTKEGQTYQGLEQQLAANAKQSREASAGMQTFADVTKMSIGYSRLFGVSLDEISSLESEMMTNMGMSLKDTKMEFSRMTSAAVDSGIAANKFFAILRGVSTDLGLYGARLGEVTKALKQMGKVMSQRTAAKFLGEFAKGMADFSTDDRLKMVLLGGPSAVKDIQDNLAKQKDEIINKLGDKVGGAANAKTLLEGGTVGGKDLATFGKEGGFSGEIGTMRESYQNTNRGIKEAGSEGVYGAAQGAKYLDAFSAYAVKKKAALSLSGKSTLEDSIGLRGEKSAEVAGVGGEKFDAMLGMERAIDQQRKDLVNAFKNPNPTAEQKKMMKLSTDQGKIMTAEQAAGASDREVWDSMADPEAERAKIADEQLKAAYESGQLTQSFMDKFDVFVTWMMNKLYGIMVSIWDTIVDIWDSLAPAGMDSGVQQAKLEVQIAKTKNQDLIDTFEKSKANGADMNKVGNDLIGNSSVGKDLYKSLGGVDDLIAERQALSDKSKAEVSKTGQVDPATVAALKDMTAKIEEGTKKYQFATKYMDDLAMSGGGYAANDTARFIKQGAEDAGVSSEKISKLLEIMSDSATANGGNPSISVESGASQAGFTDDEIHSMYQKSLYAMGQSDKVDLLNKFSGMSGTPTTATSAVTGVAGGGPSAAAAPPVTIKEPPITVSQGDTLTTGVDNVEAGLKDVKINKTFLDGPINKTMYDAVLEATRLALWEYYLYQSVDKTQMLKFAADHPSGVGQAYASDQMAMTPHATGTGPMIGMDKFGMAKFAPGEAPTSIGPGEKIVPSGGGNQSATVIVQGLVTSDFVGMIQESVSKGIYEYKLRKLRTGG